MNVKIYFVKKEEFLIMEKRLLLLLLSICLAFTSMMSKTVWAFENSWENTYDYDNDLPVIYQITNTYTPVRAAPSKDAEILQHLSNNEYIKAYSVTNEKNHEWLMYIDEDGEEKYVFSENAEKHKEHCWGAVIETEAGIIHICDCGYVKSCFFENEKVDFEFDGIEWLRQLLLGNFTDTTYATAAISNIILGFTPVGTVLDIRDITADVVNADPTNLIIDMIALIPLLDGIKVADDTNAVHYLASFDVEGRLIADDYIFLKESFKEINTGIEIHHGIEKRLEACFDVHPDNFLAIPLEVAEHRIITKRFRDAIPYGKDYQLLEYEDIIDAVNYVYKDNPEIRNTMIQWVDDHWIE